MSDKPTNKLISIGYLGCMSVYLNVSREEAIRRYRESDGMQDHEVIEEGRICEFEIYDEFSAYAVHPPF